MTEMKKVIEMLKRLSEKELRQVLDFAEFLLSKRGDTHSQPSTGGRSSRVNRGGAWEIDYDDYDDSIR